MIENFLFSLNIVLPIFLLIVLGFFLSKKGILTPDFCSRATTLVFYYALPFSLFQSVASSDISQIFELKFVLYAVAASLLLFVISWVLALALIKDRGQISAVVHGAFRGNFAYIGLAVLKNLLNTDTLNSAMMIFTFVVPIYNILAIVVLSHYDNSGVKPSITDQILKIIKNPLIIGIVCGIVVSLLKIEIPSMLDKTFSYLSQLATPLALLMIGASLKPSTFRKKPKGIILGTLIKNCLAPLLFVLCAIPFGFNTEEIATIFVLFAVPSAVNSYIMTEKMGGDGELGAGIVMATSLFSVISMTLGIFIMKSFGLI